MQLFAVLTDKLVVISLFVNINRPDWLILELKITEIVGRTKFASFFVHSTIIVRVHNFIERMLIIDSIDSSAY